MTLTFLFLVFVVGHASSIQGLGKRYRNPLKASYRPGGFEVVEAPRFQDIRHMKLVRLSAVCTRPFYPQDFFLVLISVRG